MTTIVESLVASDLSSQGAGEDEMKLDMGVVRDILLWVEENQTTAVAEIDDVPVEGRTHDEVAYHVQAMADAGFLKANFATFDTGPDEVHHLYIIRSITWTGHDLIEYLREPTGVQRAMEVAKTVGKGGLLAVYKVLENEAMGRIAAYLKGLYPG